MFPIPPSENYTNRFVPNPRTMTFHPGPCGDKQLLGPGVNHCLTKSKLYGKNAHIRVICLRVISQWNHREHCPDLYYGFIVLLRYLIVCVSVHYVLKAVPGL